MTMNLIPDGVTASTTNVNMFVIEHPWIIVVIFVLLIFVCVKYLVADELALIRVILMFIGFIFMSIFEFICSIFNTRTF